MTTEEAVIGKLKGIIDPHTRASVYEMNLISDIKVEESKVSLTFTPSSPYCPIGVQLAKAIKNGVESLGGVEARVSVKGHVQADMINQMLGQGPKGGNAMSNGIGSSPWNCPGSSALKNPTLDVVSCPYCGEENEAFSDELHITCASCGKNIERNRAASCIDWCSKVEECLGADLVAKFKGGAP